MLSSRAEERAAVERDVLAIVSALVDELGGRPGTRPVALDEALDRDLGLGSLERVELLLRLEQRSGIRLPDAVMVEAVSPRDLATAILQAGEAAPETLPAAGARLEEGRAAPASAGSLLEVLGWHAEHSAGVLPGLLRRDARRRYPRADLSAAPARPDRGLRAATGRHSEERRSTRPHHLRRGPARGRGPPRRA